MSGLLSTYKLKNFVIKNRLVVPPIVCFNYSEDGFATPKNIAHYERMASGGSGIIIVESVCVNEKGRLHVSQLGIWDDKFIDGLSKIAEAIHKHSAIALIQIHHAGVKTDPLVSDKPIAPSEYEHSNGNTARAMSHKDIQSVSYDFFTAAKRAKAAGFDGIELHGAHGYLISQFLSPAVNKRPDEYGQNRATFAADIISRIRQEMGGDFIIGVRMGGNDPDMKTCVEYARAFEKAGADILHVSTGFKDYKPEDMRYEENEQYNWIVRCGIVIKRNVHIPVIVVNGISKPSQAEYIIDENLSDFVAVGRAQLTDPNWARKLETGEPIIECRRCKRCSWFKEAANCPNYQESAE